MYLNRSISLALILLIACVDPLRVDIISGPPKLIVDGLITNEKGPYEVRLFYSKNLNYSTRNTIPETHASIWISDDQNNSEKLTEISDGVYQSSETGMQGEINRFYTLKILTASGKEYRSAPQRLMPAGELDSVYFKIIKEGLHGNQPGQFYDALNVFVDATGVIGETNLFRWRWNYIYTAKAFPERRLGYGFNGPVPDPVPCSGYVVKSGFAGLVISQVGPCTCCICYSYNYSAKSFVSNNTLSDQLEFTSVDLDKIPATSSQFYEKYFIEVDQLSISEEVYDFWRLNSIQQKATGNIFQPNAVKVRGNIQSITDPTEEVLGIFSVSGITKKSLFIERDIIPYALSPIDTLGEDCMELFPGVTRERPSFW